MIGSNSFTSNSIDSLKTIKGEIVKGVLKGNQDLVIVFESGYSLVITDGGAYWINNKEVTTRRIMDMLHDLSSEIERVNYIKNLLSFSGDENQKNEF